MTNIQKKLTAIAEERRRVLSLPPKEAMDAIISSPDGPAIVHAMADQDFHFLINDIGAEDALELLSMASNRQWEYILDIEAWDRENIVGSPAIKWFDRLMQADEDRFISWMTREKTDFLELFLSYHIEAGLRLHDQDASEIGDDFFTIDDVHYVRFVSLEKPGSVTDETEIAFRDEVLSRFLRRLGEKDHRTFQGLLYYTAGVIPAEAEEEALRLRNVRLAEKGLLPFDEAIGIYQPVKRGRPLPKKRAGKDVVDIGLPVPVTPAGLLARETVFSRALSRVDSAEALLGLQAEFAALCNRLAVADQLPVKEKKDLQHLVRKACGFLHIGLTELTGQALPDPTGTAAVLTAHFLADIFRIGYSRVMTVKSRADKWHRDSWYREKNLPISFWGETRQGMLGGLLIKRPLFCDISRGNLFREFESPADVMAAENTLEQVMTLDMLLSLADIDLAAVSQEVLTVENVLLTLWARHHLGLPEILDFIAIREFRPFLKELMGDAAGQPVATIGDDMKESFALWLAGRTGRAPEDIIQSAGPVLESFFTGIVEEYGAVTPEHIDPKFIDLFLVC